MTGLTAKLVSHTDSGTRGPLGEYTPTPTETDFQYWRHRTLRAEETPEWLTDVATKVWKTTAPYSTVLASVKPDDQLRVEGVTYAVVGGVQFFPDMEGSPFKVTILSKRQEG